MEIHDRSFAMLEVRSVDETRRTFIGVANSAQEDSHGTFIEPDGAVFTLPIPLFYHERGDHAYLPFGNIIRTWVEKGKRWVEAHIPPIPDDGTAGGRSVRDRLDAQWAEVKSGLVRGLSIDFRPIDPPRATRGTRVKKWHFAGLTVVPIPSNMDASIVSVRSLLAASGETHPAQKVIADYARESTRELDKQIRSLSPGVSGTQPNPKRTMTILEQIQQHENTRAAKVAQRDALLDKSSVEGRTLDESESETFDTLDTEIRSIDSHLVRLNSAKKDAETRAAPVIATDTRTAAQSRAGVAVVRTQDKADKGIGFARYVMSLVACNGNRYEAGEYAKRAFPESDITTEVAGALQTRAAVAAGTTTNSTFAAPLIVTNYLSEFLEMLRPRTIIGRLPGLRRVPFNVSLPTQTAGGTYSWVGQGSLKPVTNLQLSAVTLSFAKASGIIVISEELARLSTPSAQEVVRDELLAGMTQYLDTQFIDPTVAAVANVNPASISNGVAGTAASGTTEAAARVDLRALINGFNTGNLGLGGVVLLMGEGMAFTIGTIVNAVGQPAFPGITAAGGTLYGLPVITSNILTTDIYAVHAPSIMVADEGGIEIDVSREASLIMDSAPNSVVQAGAAAPVYTSLWQANLVALRAERFITWAKARTTAVRRINTAAYV